MGTFCLDYIEAVGFSDDPYPEQFFEPFAYSLGILGRISDLISCWRFNNSPWKEEPDNAAKQCNEKHPNKTPSREVQESPAIYCSF
ncbi:MAG: hypothetical protein UZ01_01749 [Candidatus Brocadia sinica]|nr:MAG: hypothetical protein UZ01_01749 [Candidatus Brocadia sinica]